MSRRRERRPERPSEPAARRRPGAGSPSDPDNPARAAPPPAISDLVGDLVRAHGWGSRLEGARVHEVWADIAGDALVRHCEPVRLHGGVLVVRVASPQWATQVRYLTSSLIERACGVLGEGRVERVQIVVGPLTGPGANREGPP